MRPRIAPAQRPRVERRGFLKRAVAGLVGGAALVGLPRRAAAGSQPFVGEIMMTAAFYAPTGWRLCDGSLLAIPDYEELWSIIGTTYGGDGVNTFALPDLRSRAPIHFGDGLGLTPRVLGESGGQEGEFLLANQMAAHAHAALAGTANGTSPDPTGLYPAQNAAGNLMYGPSPDTQLGATTTPAGGSQAHQNMQPFLAIHFCIAVVGVYPTRS